MKKLIALLLALVMVLGLVACGKGAEVAEENDAWYLQRLPGSG